MAPKRPRSDLEEEDWESDSDDDIPKFVVSPDEVHLVKLLERDMVWNMNVKWNSICGLSEVKRLLQETTVLPVVRPDLYRGKLRPSKGILLYGPPGTGKTSLAKAVATQGHTTFFNVSLATISSKWVGEGEKMIRMLFRMAEFHAPSVIFFDEVDSICSRGVSKHFRSLQAELLVQMDGLNAGEPERLNDAEEDDEDNTPSKVVVIGATNKPWKIDEAFRRRFERRIYVPLPDAEAREEILNDFVSDLNVMKGFNMRSLAALLNGFSGADIHTVCREAAMCPIRRKLEEYGHGDLGNIEDFSEIVFNGPITTKDFEASLQRCNKSVGLGDLGRFVEWTNEYGSGAK